MRMKRAVSYCTNKECSWYNAAQFELGYITERYCARCNMLGVIVPETEEYIDGPSYRQVRLEYDYHAPESRYLAIAIVTNEMILDGGVHTFRSPLVKTSRRALEMAEARLANLALNQQPEGPPSYINFDLPLEDVRLQLAALVPGLELLASHQQLQRDTIKSDPALPSLLGKVRSSTPAPTSRTRRTSANLVGG